MDSLFNRSDSDGNTGLEVKRSQRRQRPVKKRNGKKESPVPATIKRQWIISLSYPGIR